MKKIRVLFPFVEAGLGHIMPMRAIIETFSEKYGDRVEVVASEFFTETGDSHLAKYEQTLSNQVRTYNRVPAIGHCATLSCEFFGTALSSFCSMRVIGPVAASRGIEHMRELKPDVVFSTHWATNYYAEKLKENKPLTIVYCPDARLNKLFDYKSDLVLISMPKGYELGLRSRRYNEDNLKLVPFLIRNEAFGITESKKELRRRLGVPEDNFTVVMAEGGYGIGKMKKICELLVKERFPLTVLPVCGKNAELFDYLKTLKSTSEVTFRPYGYTERILELEAAADLFCGKSGNILAEPTFFGVPSVVTHFANSIEKYIADHYINTVGCAIKEFSPQKAVDLIRSFAEDGSLLEPYRRAALGYHDHFGAETAADVIWEKITERFPDILGGEKN